MDKIIFVGDLEGDLDALQKFDKELHEEGTKALIIQVGDFALFKNTKNINKIKAFKGKRGADKSYRGYRAANTAIDFKNGKFGRFFNDVIFIKGDIEDFQNIMVNQEFKEEMEQMNLYHMPNGKVAEIQGMNMAFLGGIHSPKYHYDDSYMSADNWQRNRFFRSSEIEKIVNAVNDNLVTLDVLVTHQAPHGVLPRGEEGTKKISWLLDEVKPMYCIHGHHHYNYQADYKHPDGTVTTVVGLGNFCKNQSSTFSLEI